MRYTQSKHWLIHLFIISIYILTIHSYGDFDYMYNNDTNISTQITFDNVIESIPGRHRVRRAIGDTTMSDEIDTNTASTVAVTETSTSIFIISNFNYQSDTSDTTAQTTEITSINTASSFTSLYYGIYIITHSSLATNSTLGTIQTTTTTSTTTIPVCNNATHAPMTNGTCVSRSILQNESIAILNNTNSTVPEKVDALTNYLTAIANTTLPTNASNILTLEQIDQFISNFSSVFINVSTPNSIIVITQPGQLTNATIIGASFEKYVGGTSVDTNNYNRIVNSEMSAAGIVTLHSLEGVKSFNILIIDNPTAFEKLDQSNNKTLVSSIINPTITRNNPDIHIPVHIELFFQVQNKSSTTTEEGEYLCVFYDTNSSQWNDSGCGVPTYNTVFNRYECVCNHLTSFALIWLPKPPRNFGNDTNKIVKLDAQDIVSIAAQFLSIACFIGIFGHAVYVRVVHSKEYTRPRNLLPLISCGITMILFICYIGLGLTVYTRMRNEQLNTNNTNSSQREINLKNNLNLRVDSLSTTPPPHIPVPCLRNEHAITFIVYFFIIFMFCSKTSVGYYNYRHFVELFPQPDLKELFIALAASLGFTTIWLIFAVGFNSNPSFGITEVYEGKICWFSRRVIHYFLTIPICLFLLANIIMFIFVIKCMINHARKGRTHEERYKRRKLCIFVLFSSCVTQGLGWLFGPMMLAANDNVSAVIVLGWLFVIFNGLEGVWAVLLYIIVRNEHLEDRPRARDDRYQQALVDGDDQPPMPRNDPRFQQNLELKNLASDSPRNSFTDIHGVRLSHRPNRDRNEEQ